MGKDLQNPLATPSKQSPMKEDNEVSVEAEKIVYTIVFPMVFKTALELGVIDTIASLEEGVWLSSSEIALRLPTKPTNPEAPAMLDRMLVLLASHSVVKYRFRDQTGITERVYAAEPVCMFFLNRGDGSGSIANLAMTTLSDVFFKTWIHFKDMILEGKDAFTSAHGMKLFDYIGSHKQFAEMFNKGMSEESILSTKKILEVYKGFEDVKTLVDVGGGFGTVLSLVTSKYPRIKGINFDSPAVLAHAPLYPGVEHIPGDMFVEIPKGDAIFMKWILHDWTDEDCIRILKNCRKSLPESGKVILVDSIKPVEPYNNDSSTHIVLALDVSMLTQCSGGKERSFAEIKTIAFASGFLRCEFICHAYSYSVIELHK